MTSAAREQAQEFEAEGYQNALNAVGFLQDMQPGGPWVLTAITPDGPVETCTFTDKSKARDWVQQYDGTRNLYWSVSSVMRPLATKAKKTDVKEVRFLYLDVDPRKGEPIDDERARILKRLTVDRPKGVPEPTVIVDSGNGRQTFWALKEPIQVNGDEKRAAEADRYLIQLALLLDGDRSVAECSHIMRLPFTMNLPNQVKRDAGRKPSRARVLDKTLTRVYSLTEFKQAVAPVSKAAAVVGVNVNVGAEPRRLVTIDELDQWSVPDRVKVVCVQGDHPEQAKPGDGSRSAWLFCGFQVIVDTGINSSWTPRSGHRGHRDRHRGHLDRAIVDSRERGQRGAS